MIEYINPATFIWSKWMGHMLWQVSLLTILIMLIDLAIRRRAWPYVRYVLWGLVFLKLLIPPTWQMPTSIVSMIQPKVSERIPAEYTLWYEESTPASGITEQPQDQVAESVTVEKATWQTVLFLIWIAGMLFFVLMLAIQMSRLPKRSQKRSNRDAPEWFNAVLDSTSTRLRLKKGPSVIFSRDAGSPAVYGLFRPVLVLPRGYFDHLTREEAEHVLLHELFHIKRGDLWVHWFCILLQIVYWFNPLLILARRQLGHVSEICCDLSVAYVLREKTVAYRETLLNTSHRFLSDAVKPGIGLLGIFEEPSRIIARLKWLERKTWENRKRKIAVTLFTILVMFLFVMPMNGLSRLAAPNENLQAQPDNSASEVERGKIQTSDIPSPLTQVETLILESEANEATNIPLSPHDEAVIVSVNKDGQVFISDYEVTVDFLGEKLLEILEGRESREVLLNADKSVPYGVVIRVMSEIKAAGIEKLGMVTDPEVAVSTSSKPKEEVFIVSGEPIAQAAAETASASNAASDPQGDYVLSMLDTDITVLIETISEITGKTFIIDSNVKGKVNVVSPENITKDEAYRFFESVLEMNGFALEPAGKFIKVVPVSTATHGEVERPLTTRISLRRSQVDSAMANLTETMTQLTIMPYSYEGVEGLELSNIKPNSIFRRMGLRIGDVLVAVEGEPFTSADQVLQLFENLKTSDTVNLEISRRGRVRTIEYRIQ